MKPQLLIVSALFVASCFGQKTSSRIVVKPDTTGTKKYGWVFVNYKGDTLRRLDTAKYTACLTDTFRYFAIVLFKDKAGWWAIDKKETPLFRVFNTSPGEAAPDELRDGFIRIIDDSEKIGYADYKGKVLIRPQFEAASSFYKGKAIVGKKCKQVLWCCAGQNEDKHYLTECSQTGYIDTKGRLQIMTNLTFGQIQKKIGWKSLEDD